MFRERTILILGAGASKPYGFPLGFELIDEIINCIKNDTVLYPLTPTGCQSIKKGSYVSLKEYSIFSNQKEILKNIRDNIKNGKIKEISRPKRRSLLLYSENDKSYYIHSRGSFCSTELYNIKLCQIKELNELAQKLENFDSGSIDSFLSHNPEYKIAGQTMIIYCLIKFHSSQQFKRNQVADNWYRYLLNDIKSGCKNPSDLLLNKLSILTFNYDVSLDFYILNDLLNTSFFFDYANQYLRELNINHVYGSICDLNEINDFFDLEANDLSEEVRGTINFHHLLYGYLNSFTAETRIKLIGDRISDNKFSNAIKYADTIIFLGFSFEPDNMSILGFPTSKSEYADFLIGNKMGGMPSKKKIFYLDHEGKGHNLNNKFLELQTHMTEITTGNPWLNVTRSPATKISDAYEHEFRSRLFT